jgi:hypothetical protein
VKVDKRLVPLAVAIVLALTLFWQFWPSAVAIDDSWWIVYKSDDPKDSLSASWLALKYGSKKVSILTVTTQDLDREGLDLVFIGGSKILMETMPWVGDWVLSVVQQTPPVRFSNDGTWSNSWIQTPKGRYHTNVDGDFIHDYGYITKVYDQEYNRWLIVCIGWSAECTATGAKILIEDFTQIQQHDWIVYEYLGDSMVVERRQCHARHR